MEDVAFSRDSDGRGAKRARTVQQEMSAAGALIHGSIGRWHEQKMSDQWHRAFSLWDGADGCLEEHFWRLQMSFWKLQGL